MKASEGALESSYRAVSGLDAGWVRGGVLGDTALRPIRVFVSELDVLAIPYGRPSQSHGHNRRCRRSRGSRAFKHAEKLPTRPHLLYWAKYEA